jgi:hypothetical protein
MVNSRCLRISSSCPCITPACRLQSVGNRIRKRCNYDSGEGGNQSVVTIKPFYSVFYPYPRPSGRRINKFFSIVSRLLVVSEKYILLLWGADPVRSTVFVTGNAIHWLSYRIKRYDFSEKTWFDCGSPIGGHSALAGAWDSPASRRPAGGLPGPIDFAVSRLTSSAGLSSRRPT